MRLTHESPRTRWLILLGAWALVAALGWWHTLVVNDYVSSLARAVQRTPPAATPMQRPCPSNYSDAFMWVRYALALQEGAPWQVRHTDIDNAPEGREVHWDSGFAHLIAAAGRLQHAVTGEPLPRATEHAMMWFNLPLLLAVAAGFSIWTARRAGAAAGALVAVGTIGFEDFYAGFSPNYVDHHGLLSAAALGVVLGAWFMGGGWWRAHAEGEAGLLPASKAEARQAATLSAVCGAFGMWISAATTIPVIVIVGASAVLASWWGAGAARAEGAQFAPELWRWWGRLGAVLSVGFYLLEYAPSHLGVRLEVNHPFHALAWWAGAELVAVLVTWRVEGPGGKPAAWSIAWPVLALGVAPLAVAVLGERAFVAGDPFVAQLSNNVAEGITLWRTVEVFGWRPFFWHVNFQLVPLLLGLAACVRREQKDKLLLGFATAGAAVFVAMGFWKVRWWSNAGGPLLALLVLALMALLARRTARTRWLVVGVTVLVGMLPMAYQRVWRIDDAVKRHVAGADDLIQPIYRDVAAALRTATPQGDIVLLSSPNASVAVGYYGRIKTLGTLYWENTAGLRAAAEIFSATTDDEALRLIQRHGITHLAMISKDNYLAEYFALLHPQAAPGDYEKTFGYRILFQYRLPGWLRAIPYQRPKGVNIPDLVVRLFQVAPSQSVAEAYWYLGTAELAVGETDDGERKLQHAIEELPPANRLAQRIIAGNACYEYGAHAAAVRFYRSVLAEGENATVSRGLAWILATSPNDTVRDGRSALTLIERLTSASANDPELDCIAAAAFAEAGRFAEAIPLAERALAGSRASGDQRAAELNAKRLEAYRAGKAWRQ